MSSRTNRAFILAASKTLNYAVQFITPIFLVRILDREAYGQYREFFVYVGLIGTFIDFSIKYNILYFISKNPSGIKKYITNTIFLKLFVSVIGIAGVYIFKNQVLGYTTFNFLVPLLIFLFLMYNFDFLEAYWLAQKKSNYVFYYSFIYMLIRVIIVISTAYITKSVIDTIYVLMILELLKFLFNLAFVIYRKLIVLEIDYKFLKEQLVYIVPLGLASILLQFNIDVSKVIISSSFGAGALALYAIASQRVPIINIVTSAISDVIFPDMAESIEKNPKSSLDLWRRANILYLFLMVPLFYLQFFYAELIIKILFTKEYLDAVPIFQIYLIFFLKQCFDMGIPIRVMNQNKYMIIGYIFSTIINVGMIFLLLKVIGFWGPAVAYVLSEALLAVYFANRIMSIYNLTIQQLFYWKKIFVIIGVGFICLPVLFISKFITMNEILSAVLFSSIYIITYLVMLRSFKIEETNLLMVKLLKKLKLAW